MSANTNKDMKATSTPKTNEDAVNYDIKMRDDAEKIPSLKEDQEHLDNDQQKQAAALSRLDNNVEEAQRLSRRIPRLR